MKFAGIIGIIILVTIILFSWGSLVDDFEQNYIETGISDASNVSDSFKSTYNRRVDLNETFYPLQQDFEDIQQQDGWLDVIGDGSIAVIKSIARIPTMIISTITYAIADGTSMFTQIGIPNEIILLAGFVLILFIFFKLIAILRRYEA